MVSAIVYLKISESGRVKTHDLKNLRREMKQSAFKNVYMNVKDLYLPTVAKCDCTSQYTHPIF